MNSLFHDQVFVLVFTLGVFYASSKVYKKTQIGFFHPVLLSILFIMSVLLWAGVDYPVYKENARMIDFFLSPAVVAIGVTLHEQFEHIKRNSLAILVSLFAGSLVGVASVVGIAWLMGADRVLLMTLAPKAVTTPIAMSVAQQYGGIPALTAIIVILVGVLGSIVGPMLFKWMGIDSRIAKGLALGSAAHGLGTARAMEMGTLEGAIGGLSIGVTGVMTALLVGLLNAAI